MTDPEPQPDGAAEFVAGLLDAYRQGLFPMADPATGAIALYTADPRGVLPLTEAEGFHEPRTVARALRRGDFELTSDEAFEGVMRGCALPRADQDDEEEGWISDDLVRVFGAMHRAGAAHSVEAWRRDPGSGRRVLVGGVYGVSIGGLFCAESMFHLALPRRPDGSRDPLDGSGAGNAALVALVRHLRASGFSLLDTQMVTGHVARFGAREIPAAEYRERLAGAVAGPDRWRPLGPGAAAGD